jgi:hypothetical protein
MHKRAELTFNQILMTFFRMFILFLVCGVFVFFVSSFWNMKLQTEEVEAELFSQALINSQNGISYAEKDRVYQGVIDYMVFMQTEGIGKRLEDTFSYGGKRPMSAKLELLSKGGPYKEAKPVYYNREFYDVWYPIGKTMIPGVGGALVLEKTLPVLVKDGADYNKAALKLTIAVPRS